MEETERRASGQCRIDCRAFCSFIYITWMLISTFRSHIRWADTEYIIIVFIYSIHKDIFLFTIFLCEGIVIQYDIRYADDKVLTPGNEQELQTLQVARGSEHRTLKRNGQETKKW